MNVNEPFTFRTTRAPRDGAPRDAAAARGVESGGESVVAFALHRAAMEAAQPRPRPAEAEVALETSPAPAERPAPVEVEAEAAVEVAEPIGPDQPIAAMTAPEVSVPLPSRVLTVVQPGGKLYLVARARGGVGATTFAVNLALGLCGGKAGARVPVALVDLDLQFGTVASSLDLVDRGGLLALVQYPQEPDGLAVSAALQRHDSGLSVLPAPKRPIPLDALDAMRMASILNALLASHAAVVVDLPPALVTWLEPLLRRATKLFMVTDLSVTSVGSARRVLDTLREDRADLPVEIVVSREKKPLFGSKLPAEVSAALDAPLRHWLADDAKVARLALDRGEPVMKAAPSSSLARGIRKIAEELGE